VLASLVASLALPAGTIEKVLIHSIPKFALEDSGTPRRDLQVKEVLETLTDSEPSDW